MKAKTVVAIGLFALVAVILAVIFSGGKYSIFSSPAQGLFQFHGWYANDDNIKKFAVITDDVKINDYNFHITQGTGSGPSCVATMTVSKNNQQILGPKTYKQGEQEVIGGITVEPMNSGNTYWYDCQSSRSVYNIRIPDNAINVSVATPKTQYFEGQNVTVEVKIKNSWSATNAKLDLDFSVPTAIGSATMTQTQNIYLNLGDNTFYYSIPTSRSTEKILVTPKVSIVLPSTSISGLNSWRSTTYAGTQYVPVQGGWVYNSQNGVTEPPIDYNLGTAVEKTFEIMIIPKPLYLDPPCIAGYSINSLNTYCVRDDIKSLSCYQLGCPKVEGHDYACTSSGQCAETVYKTVWGNCPGGTTQTTTDVGEKICIKTEIAETILGCEQTQTPPQVCLGIIATCINHIWEFSGQCEVKTETQTIESVKEVVKTVEVVREVPSTPIITRISYIPLWVYAIIAVLVIAVIVAWKKVR